MADWQCVFKEINLEKSNKINCWGGETEVEKTL